MVAGFRVWLNGERFDVAYLLDVDTAHVERFETLSQAIGATAGHGERVLGGRLVGWFVSPHDHRARVVLGPRIIEPDDCAEARTRRLGRLASRLDLRLASGEHLACSKITSPWDWLLTLLDPGYGMMEAELEDLLGNVQQVLLDERRQEVLAQRLDADAGPWHLTN